MHRLLAVVAGVSALAGCAHARLDWTPLPAGAAVCPADGCDPRAGGSSGTALAAADACGQASAAPCGGAPADQCTSRALSAWSQAPDDRSLRCVAHMLSDACSLDDARACGFAGRLWLDGRAVPADAQHGMTLLVQGCDGGFAPACAVALRWLNDPSHKNDGDDVDELRGRLESENSCWLGQADTCYQVGREFREGSDGYPQDLTRSVRAFEQGCALGGRECCNDLGDALAYGDGLARDVNRSAALFDRACRLGYPLACANLGYMAEHGLGVPHDDARARGLYRDACVAGTPYACVHMEMMAAQDAGAPRDPVGAIAHWRRGCLSHDARSCAFLSLLYLDGPDGLNRDISKHTENLTLACRYGMARACEWLRGDSD